uniref:Uncharacterized protein n=1 Tax=Lactuca sativa TaxID=4236 RepID=A0A9R1XKW6_LACSA|nr:hypothetical protein LSAT_V11C400167400 [Lactuca sativa]
MGSYSDNEDEFFDAREAFASMSDSGSDCSPKDCSTTVFDYDYWVGNLEGVESRCDKFLRLMGLNSKWLVAIIDYLVKYNHGVDTFWFKSHQNWKLG